MPNPAGRLYNQMGIQLCNLEAWEKSAYCPLHVGVELISLTRQAEREGQTTYMVALPGSGPVVSQCSTAGGTQRVLHWYTADSAPNTLPADVKSSRQLRKTCVCAFVTDVTPQNIMRLPTKICSRIFYQKTFGTQSHYPLPFQLT